MSHTAAADCARVVDTAASRRVDLPVCMSAEELSRAGLSPESGEAVAVGAARLLS